MTMEFLTLSDAQARTETKIGRMILQTALAASPLLQRMHWTIADEDQSKYDQISANVPVEARPGDATTLISDEVVTKTVNLCQAVNKAHSRENDMVMIPEMVTDMARDLERTALGNDDLFDLSPLGIVNLLDMRQRERAERVISGHDLDVLISRLGKFWDPDTCVFLIASNLYAHLFRLGVVNVHTTMPPTYRGALMIPSDAFGFRRKIACVSLDPACGLFGIGKGQLSNRPCRDVREGERPDFGRVLGWQIETGIKVKADPIRPEEVKAADENGMFETMELSWFGAFGLVNQNAGASIEGLICP